MADQDPYEAGALWIRQDHSNRRVRILAVLEDALGLVPMRQPTTYVITTPSMPGESMPQVWVLSAFLNWHRRPDGGQPRPHIPRQPAGRTA